jgi:MarR family transcriptional regulator, lower aerobic nicotinate degradation pathway regulator
MEQLPSYLLTQTAAHASRLVTDGFAAVGARGYHYRMLATLREAGPASQADLGRRTGIHFSDVVATLNELTDGGYVERAPDPADRRRNVVTITERGEQRADELLERARAIQDELLAPLSPAERATLAGLLDRVLTHLRAGATTE